MTIPPRNDSHATGQQTLQTPQAEGATDAAALHAQDKALLATIIREASIHEELPTVEALLERLNERINTPPSHEEDAREQEERTKRLQDFASNTDMQEAYEESASDADSLILQQRLVNRRELFNSIFSARREENYGGVIVRGPEERKGAPVAEETNKAVQANGAVENAGETSALRLIDSTVFPTLLAETLAENDDLALLKGLDGGEYYHSPSLLSVTYAEIITGKEVPLAMIVETVRKNSREYPRPIALEIFEYPPFDLTPEELEGCLHKIAADPESADIKYVESCVGTVYLYSERYLDEDYASFLADKEDVGMVESP